MKKVTLKELRNDPRYIKGFRRGGNKKLRDAETLKYAQFNLPPGERFIVRYIDQEVK